MAVMLAGGMTVAFPGLIPGAHAANANLLVYAEDTGSHADFGDQTGQTAKAGGSAGIKASTGSVSLDRTVYPVPFGTPGSFGTPDTSTILAQGSTDTWSAFPIHQSGVNDQSGLQAGEFLPQGDLIVYVTVTDSDFDVSASGTDSIAIDAAPVTVSVIRGSQSVAVGTLGGTSNPIYEAAPGVGIFESSVTIRYSDGPNSPLCPSGDDGDANTDTDDKGCISMWELISFHVVFMVCVIASARGVSSPQGLKNSDTYPFEALPHYHSLSICQNYFAISATRLSLNA